MPSSAAGKVRASSRVEIDCLLAFAFPRFHLFLLSSCPHDLDVCRPAIESRSDCSARQAARAKHQDPILAVMESFS